MVKALVRTERRDAWTFLVATTAALIAFAVLASTAEAQGRGYKAGKIPPGHMPPPGSCRVWRDGVPPGRQAPAMSCADARYEAARYGGRVVYGGSRDDRDYRYGRDRYPDDRYPDDRYPRDEYPYPDGRYPRDTYPMSLPEMIGAVIFGQGLPVRYVQAWLGRNDVRVTYSDADRNRYPELATWYDPRGTIVQQWYDDNRDGRADRVAVYRAGRVERVLR
jgi:hypothetical protein